MQIEHGKWQRCTCSPVLAQHLTSESKRRTLDPQGPPLTLERILSSMKRSTFSDAMTLPFFLVMVLTIPFSKSTVALLMSAMRMSTSSSTACQIQIMQGVKAANVSPAFSGRPMGSSQARGGSGVKGARELMGEGEGMWLRRWTPCLRGSTLASL